jgi:molybdate transport repressor ModE-like protein
MRNVLSLPKAFPKAQKMPIRFDLVDLRLFVHVADSGSITHAASRASMALGSASERIRAMEEALGTPLLERKRRGVQLTPAGSALAQHARIVTLQVEHMRGDLNGYAKGLKGHVRVHSNTVAISEFLPAALAAFLSAHPNIDVDLEEKPSRDIVRAVGEGRADIGVIADIVDPAEQLETFPLGEDRLVVVTPRRHALGRRRKIAFREVLSQEFIGLASGSALQDYLDHHAAREGHRMKLRIRLNGFDSICRMVENNIGLAILPGAAARRCQKSMAIRIVALTDAWALRHFAVCVRSLKALPAHAQRLVGFLRRA